MIRRTIRHSHDVEEHLQRLGIGFQRYDDMMAFIEQTLCAHPEMFPVLKGTRISLCKSNEFVGNSFRDIPALAFYFHYDDQFVYILSVEGNQLESYGG